MSLIIPANSAVSGGYDVANSCMFNSADSANMNITFGTVGHSTNKRFTYSFWVKRGALGEQVITSSYYSSSYYAFIKFGSGNTLEVYDYRTSAILSKITTRLFRDVGAWYHIVVSNDNSVASPELKVYVNGVQETSFTTTNEYTQNQSTSFNNDYPNYIGQKGDDSTYFNGYLAEFCFIDSSALTPTDFGEFDEDSGIWKPIDVSGLTFGDNGFYLDFEDSANLGNDANGGTDLTETNLAATDQATDTCTNNFATWNSLNFNLNANTLSNGNTKMNGTSDAAYPNSITSIGMPKSGKWYAEFKDVGTEGFALGIADMPTFINALRTDTSATIFTTGGSGAAILRSAGDVIISGSETSGVTPSFSQNDIAMIAYDADNGAIYFGRNGTFGSVGGVVGNPTSGASRTGAINISGQSWLTASQEVGFIVGSFSGSKFSIIEANFGNPFFAITSGNADGDGSGDFEYAVPSGYFALCTKNLAEYG